MSTTQEMNMDAQANVGDMPQDWWAFTGEGVVPLGVCDGFDEADERAMTVPGSIWLYSRDSLAILAQKINDELAGGGAGSVKAKQPAHVTCEHHLYTNSDTDRPSAICDRNGEVVLGLCKVCGRSEVELEKPCAHTAAREVR